MGNILTTADVVMCPHGGSVSMAPGNTRAKAGGAFIVRPGDTFTVAGCPFTLPSGTPHPCVTVQWQMPAARTKAVSDNVLTRDSIGLCKAADQAVQGTAMIQQTQTKASAQ